MDNKNNEFDLEDSSEFDLEDQSEDSSFIKELQNLPGKELTTKYINKQLPSELESFIEGSKEGLTGGFSDELTGSVDTALDINQSILNKLTLGAVPKSPTQQLVEADEKTRAKIEQMYGRPSVTSPTSRQEELLKTYKQGRDEARLKSKLAAEANPLSYGGGMLTGGLVGGIASSPLVTGSTLAQGMKFGAISGLGTSEAELTEPSIEEVKQTIEDVGTGAALGGVTGLALDKAIIPAAISSGKAIGSATGKLARKGVELLPGKAAAVLKDKFDYFKIPTEAIDPETGKLLKTPSGNIALDETLPERIQETYRKDLTPFGETVKSETSKIQTQIQDKVVNVKNLQKQKITNLNNEVKEIKDSLNELRNLEDQRLKDLQTNFNLKLQELKSGKAKAIGKNKDWFDAEIDSLQTELENKKNLFKQRMNEKRSELESFLTERENLYRQEKDKFELDKQLKIDETKNKISEIEKKADEQAKLINKENEVKNLDQKNKLADKIGKTADDIEAKIEKAEIDIKNQFKVLEEKYPQDLPGMRDNGTIVSEFIDTMRSVGTIEESKIAAMEKALEPLRGQTGYKGFKDLKNKIYNLRDPNDYNKTNAINRFYAKMNEEVISALESNGQTDLSQLVKDTNRRFSSLTDIRENYVLPVKNRIESKQTIQKVIEPYIPSEDPKMLAKQLEIQKDIEKSLTVVDPELSKSIPQSLRELGEEYNRLKVGPEQVKSQNLLQKNEELLKLQTMLEDLKRSKMRKEISDDPLYASLTKEKEQLPLSKFEDTPESQELKKQLESVEREKMNLPTVEESLMTDPEYQKVLSDLNELPKQSTDPKIKELESKLISKKQELETLKDTASLSRELTEKEALENLPQFYSQLSSDVKEAATRDTETFVRYLSQMSDKDLMNVAFELEKVGLIKPEQTKLLNKIIEEKNLRQYVAKPSEQTWFNRVMLFMAKTVKRGQAVVEKIPSLNKEVTSKAVSRSAGLTQEDREDNYITTDLYKSNPEELSGVADKLLSSNNVKTQEYGRVLKKASQAENQQSRIATIFALMQDPKFRELQNQLNKSGRIEDGR